MCVRKGTHFRESLRFFPLPSARDPSACRRVSQDANRDVVLAELARNQHNSAAWRRESAPEPAVGGSWPLAPAPGEVGGTHMSLEVLVEGGAGRPLGSSSTHISYALS